VTGPKTVAPSRAVRRVVIVATLVLTACPGGGPPPSASRPGTSASTSSTPGTSPASSSSPSASPTPTGSSLPTRAEFDAVAVRLRRVVTLKGPMAIATRPGDDRLYVAQRLGFVWILHEGKLRSRPLLDISDRISFGGDRGLLGATFSPDGSYLYVYYTDQQVVVHVVAFPFDGEKIDPNSGRDIIAVPQPTIRHHGGDIHFGPDGYLWIGLGDGADEDDPTGNAQDLGKLLGKLVRIGPAPEAARPYAIPPDNPFLDTPGARPEIFAYGLRNPWRWSFDRATGDVWIGDVGQYTMEEIDFLPAGEGGGANFGWNRLEGTLPFSGEPPRDAVAPIHEYRHTLGRCAIMGGRVYRGLDIPALVGAYVYADLCDGRVRALVEHDGRYAYGRDLGVDAGPSIVAFGEGPDGTLYVLKFSGIFELQQK
jgi:glucose/arabinose dehydrogenase